MASSNKTLSQLGKQKKWLQQEIAGVSRMIMGRLTCVSRMRLVPRTRRGNKRSIQNSTRFEVGGSISRSIILALPNVHIEGLNSRIVMGGLVIAVVIVTLVTTTTPNRRNNFNRFERGSSYHLDVIVAPLDVDKDNPVCAQFAQNYSDRLGDVLAGKSPAGAAIWTPQQVNDTFAPAQHDDTYIRRYSTEHQADVILYGSVECDGMMAVVRPQIYAAPSFYADAPEMIDFFRFDDMTEQINTPIDISSIEQTINRQAERMVLLINIGRGYHLSSAGSTDENQKAAALFEQLAHAGSVKDRRGLAMLWYMAGKARLTGMVDACDKPNADQLSKATRNFHAALQQEQEFALAYAYLGNLSLFEAITFLNGHGAQQPATLARLKNSIAFFQRARTAMTQPVDGMALSLAALGKAQAKAAIHDLNPTSPEGQKMLAEAMGHLNEVISIENASTKTGREAKNLLARAYALMGDIQHAQLNDDQALSSFRKASLVYEDDSRLKTAVALSLAELYTVQGSACAAAESYQIAAQTACWEDKRAFALQAQQMQFFCQRRNDLSAR